MSFLRKCQTYLGVRRQNESEKRGEQDGFLKLVGWEQRLSWKLKEENVIRPHRCLSLFVFSPTGFQPGLVR
jgi:hypothetical protein